MDKKPKIMSDKEIDKLAKRAIWIGVILGIFFGGVISISLW